MTKIYGVSANGQPLLRTLFGHPRGAMVNFLIAHARIPITNDMSYETIKDRFEEVQRVMKGSDYDIQLFESTLQDVTPIAAPENHIGDD